jgi:hypothetical protein
MLLLSWSTPFARPDAENQLVPDKPHRPLRIHRQVLGNNMPKKDTFRIVARATDGSLLIRDYPSVDPLMQSYSQIGVDDCSTDLALRGMPVFRGLVGPMPEGKNVVRYETAEVFEMLTKEWGQNKPRKRNRSRAAAADGAVRAAS